MIAKALQMSNGVGQGSCPAGAESHHPGGEDEAVGDQLICLDFLTLKVALKVAALILISYDFRHPLSIPVIPWLITLASARTSLLEHEIQDSV